MLISTHSRLHQRWHMTLSSSLTSFCPTLVFSRHFHVHFAATLHSPPHQHKGKLHLCCFGFIPPFCLFIMLFHSPSPFVLYVIMKTIISVFFFFFLHYLWLLNIERRACRALLLRSPYKAGRESEMVRMHCLTWAHVFQFNFLIWCCQTAVFGIHEPV